MGLDGRTIRIMAFCFVFLGTFVTLLGLTPGEFAVSTKQYAGFADKVPDSWNGIDLQRYNFTGAWNTTLTASAHLWNFDVGGRNLKLEENIAWGNRLLELQHRYGFGLLWSETLNWYDRNGIKKSVPYGISACIYEDVLNDDFTANRDIQLDAECLGLGGGSFYFKIKVLFAFNTTEYALPSDAWDAAALDILVGITMDYASSAMDAWYLVASLLTFNTVEVFGNSAPESVAINFILALPFLACIIIPAALFLLEVIDRLTPL